MIVTGNDNLFRVSVFYARALSRSKQIDVKFGVPWNPSDRNALKSSCFCV